MLHIPSLWARFFVWSSDLHDVVADIQQGVST